jgi:hypothetical protein
MAAHPSLVKLSEEFRKDVIELAPNHYITVISSVSNNHQLMSAFECHLNRSTQHMR